MADNDQETINKLRRAIGNGAVDEVRSLISADGSLLRVKTIYGSWLHLAALRGKLAIVQLLIEGGFDIDVQGGPYEGGAISSAAHEGRLEVVRFLHGCGARLDTEKSVSNPLFGAILGNHIAVARFLIDHGIDTSSRTGALKFAQEYGRKEIVEMIDASARIDAYDKPMVKCRTLDGVALSMVDRAAQDGQGLLGSIIENVGEAIGARLEAYLGGLVDSDNEKAVMSLAALWGRDVVHECKWHWIIVTGTGGESVALSDDEGRYLVYPFDYFLSYARGTCDVSPLALKNCIVAGHLPPSRINGFRQL